jgi:hypothetical protein
LALTGGAKYLRDLLCSVVLGADVSNVRLRQAIEY